MTERTASLVDLPIDILVLIFPHLDARSFLSLCRTCKSFQQPSIRLDPAYWRYATQTTFRVPNQPVVQQDGERWQKMYRKMLTQSRVFTWGSSSMNRLGHSYNSPWEDRLTPRQRWLHHRSSCTFPTEMDNTQGLGIIADMQCGGWSTTLLTSKGTLFTVGVLDGLLLHHSVDDGLQALHFPPGYPRSTTEYDEPSIAIRQFSSGRSHILGLSDSGRIWSWYDVQEPALHVKFMHVDIKEPPSREPATNQSLYGRVKKVVAGWSLSSAYVYGTGIVLWSPVQRQPNDAESDTMLVTDTVEVPKTAYQRIKGASRKSDEDQALGNEVGVVFNYIILEHFIVFVTDIGKAFFGRFGEANKVDEVLELRALHNECRTQSDVQGSFRSFAIFKNGEVITTHQDYLERCWEARHTNPDQSGIEGLKRIPALQQNDVISIAFGDYHFLALHSTGKITSYGKELQGCGALGLGGDGDPEGRTRGIRYTGITHDGVLVPHAYTHGRQVWFEQEKKKWITYMTSGGRDPEEAKDRMRLFMQDANVQGEVSEWFEQEGRDWDKAPALKDADEDGLGAYFALSISAAGWHSGALVLVNKKLADRIRENSIVKDPEAQTDSTNPEAEQGESSSDQQQHQELMQGAMNTLVNHTQTHLAFTDPVAHGAIPGKGYKYIWADKSFPRLRLSDGTVMPGDVEFDEWRFGRPDWQLDIDV
ncbi:hypothetical protein K469DRAFT_699600 [Zopfia rhizophila CBS 207.26]|uniref:F-box domain-containing protein n=1 Tax=Zopfia rhizophila CBS 207.26 TaxID=1314779 RepID=A0A6A6EHE5_9PEZI|nr:hypothetical protein K469DRAFT_699600 [Zopfia rhizophila CBS 207.26]